MKPPVHKVVIVGAGFGGLRVALELQKRSARIGQGEITIIDRHPHHLYTPLLYEVCSGALMDARREEVAPLRKGVAVELGKLTELLRRKRVRYVHAEVNGIDHEKKEIQFTDGKTLAFDDVVIATGSATATFNIPGITEHALTMKTLEDALHIRKRIASFLASEKHGSESKICITIGGAGATGTEFAAELGHFFQRLVSEQVLTPEQYMITLVEAGPAILSMCRPAVQQVALKRLAQLGVRVMTNTKILEVKKGSLRVAIGAEAKEEACESDVTVWTGGIQPSSLVAKLAVPRDERGYITVEPSLEVQGMPEVYALGDCVTFMHPKTKKRVPALAQAAERQAAIVAENIVRHLERKPLVTWAPPESWITVVPLGGKHAIADFGRFHVDGVIGYAIRKAADFLYFFTTLPPRLAWRVWAEGGSMYMRND